MKKNILSLLVVVGLIGSVSASVLSGDLTNDLVAWYPFNGDANDYSGNGRDLTLRQPEYASYTSGYNNQLALNLGGNNRADYFTSNTTDVTSNWSFSCWINPPSISYNFPEWSCLFDTTNLYGTEMGLSYGNNINTQTTYYNQGVFGPEFSAGKWQNITMTLQGSIYNVYYNGGLLAHYPSDIGTRPLGLGNYFLFNSGGYQYPYIGLVQNVEIWSTALSSQQVSQLYSLQSVPEPSTYALFGIGAIGILMVMRRKKTA